MFSRSVPPSGGRLARRSPASRARLAVAALAASCSALGLAPALSALTVDFSDVNLATPPAQAGFGGVFYNGSDGAGAWSSGGVGFNNSYTDFGGGFYTWNGFAYSTAQDLATGGFENQYSAYAPAGTGAYAVAYPASTITFAGSVAPTSVSLTNVTYAALDMAGGSAFSKKFGGASGDDPDFFSVTFTGYNAGHAATGQVTFRLADFTFANNSLDTIVDEWTTVDLTGLGVTVKTIELSFASSDVGAFGINTPTYVALDNLVYASAIPEPASLAALAGAGLLGFAALRRRRVRSGGDGVRETLPPRA